MEQSREEAHQQQKQQQIPLNCPRCGSLDTRFRYFNNNSLTQPRRHCRTCKRQWTVGGKLRLIPIGCNTRNGKQTKASSSKGSNSRSQPTQPPLSLGDGHQQPTLTTATVSQNFDTTLLQPMTNMPEAVSAPQQAISQQNSVTSEPYQTHTEATSAPPSHFYNSGSVQPYWPMNYLPQDIAYDSSFTIPNACLQNNLSCDTTDTEDTTYVNVDEWLNFQGCDPA